MTPEIIHEMTLVLSADELSERLGWLEGNLGPTNPGCWGYDRAQKDYLISVRFNINRGQMQADVVDGYRFWFLDAEHAVLFRMVWS